MNVLLDTHTLIWSILESDKLSKRVIDVLEDSINEVNVSVISLWEISIKYSLGKLELSGVKPESFPDLIVNAGFQLLAVLPDVAASAYLLPKYQQHKDPFDRLLIWQALKGNLTLISKDQNFNLYQKDGLSVFW